ncbi:MAG TPA: PilC/PilY family type IV pilus protein [Casimicrobiaceae bacterium]|nr:PilC/PilY family type IV pilus protein [Casimicrobiaceae bacterium]
MNPLTHAPLWRRWLAGVMAVLVGLGPLATPGYAALTALGDQPLSVQNQAKPNIMLTVDDSTSMRYDYLPDQVGGGSVGTLVSYCRDITGKMNAACGVRDQNTDLTFIGHGKYQTHGYVYEQFGFPFPAFDSAYDTSGPGAGCATASVATSTCSGGIDPGPLPGIERFPGPPGPGKSPLAGNPYAYWQLWPAPAHNTELNHAYYNPRLTYDPPVYADGTSYPQMNAANTVNWTKVPADPWAATIQYIDLTQKVTVGLWCNSDWSLGLTNDPANCRTNGTGPSASSSSASTPDGDYNYPWAPPGIDPSAGGTTALSIAYSKVDATTHALLPPWATAQDPKFFYENDNTLWCDSTSPLWPQYGPLQTQTCSDPPPVVTPQSCNGVIDQTCGGGTPQTCLGVTPQTCNGWQSQTCNNINSQTCIGAQPQTCTGQTSQTCAGGGAQTCTGITPQTCAGATSPTCVNPVPQTCNGAVIQHCGGITGQTCNGVTGQFCANLTPQACNGVTPQSCNLVGEVCNLPNPATCPVDWIPPGCNLCTSECGTCQLGPVCPPGVCSVTGGQCEADSDCPGTKQCSVTHAACASSSDCPPQAGTCAITHDGCFTSSDCPPTGQCNVSLAFCEVNGDCPVLSGTCSSDGTACFSDAQCPAKGLCTSSGAVCTSDAQCPNTPGVCSVVPSSCFADADCPNEGTCSDTGLPCTSSAQCPPTAGACTITGLPCFADAQCPPEGHCTLVGNLCQGPPDCPTQPGACTITGTACFSDAQCLPAGGQCTVTHAACVVNPDCPTVPGACSQDAQPCVVNSDCAPSGQCSVTSAVCHSTPECPIVPGTCSTSGFACTADASCPTLQGACSVTGTACFSDAQCSPTGMTCSITGQSCDGSTYTPFCEIPPSYTCSEPAHCPRQGGTCSVDGSACTHLFEEIAFPPFFDFWWDYAYCPAVSVPGKCSIDHNSCMSDSMCPPIPSASATAVCSDLVAGSSTTTIAVPNGSFEAPAIGDYVYNPAGASWTFSGSSGIQHYWSSFQAWPSGDGLQTSFIQGLGSMSQTINLNPGSYRITFIAAPRWTNVPAGTTQPVLVSVDGVPLGSPAAPALYYQYNTFAYGFSIATAGPHTITFAGTDGSGDKTTFIDSVSITSGMSLLEDANGSGLVCRHNNQAYSGVSANRYNYPNVQFNTPVTGGTGPNACVSSARYAYVPRHYYKTGVEWCDAQVATAGDKWIGYGTPTGGTCQDSTDVTHLYPRFYQFGQDPSTDNYATPAFQRMDLDPTVNPSFTHTWTDDSGQVQTVTRSFDGATPDVSEMTNYANWFAYYRTRIQGVKSVTSLTFSELDSNYRVGFHNLFKLSSFVNISDFGAAQKAIWFAQLFGVTIPLGQETPSLDALVRIGDYYKNGSQPQLVGSTDPIELSCQKNWHMFFTDGYTNQNGLPATTVGDQDDVVPALPAPLPPGTVPMLTAGQPWPAPFRENPLLPASNSLSDYAMYYWVTDLRTSGPQSVNNVPTSPTADPASWQHQNFAAISLGTSGKLPAGSQSTTESQLDSGALQWPQPYPTVFKPDNSGVDDLWHAAINGRGRFVNAQSADEVKLGIGQILADIVNQSGVRAGVGFQNINLGPTANFYYRVGFEPDWGGSLIKIAIDPMTGVTGAAAWSASGQLDTQLQITVSDPQPWFSKRKIVTMNESGVAVPFLLANLGPHQQDSLAPGSTAARQEMILEFLRGNRLKEGTKLGQLRARPTALGDIVDSSAVFVGPPSAPYRESDDSGYAAFMSTFSGRAAEIYAGANDGMLHAFDDATGNETWAYIPSPLYRGGLAGGDPKTGLGALAYQDGALPPFKHHYYVDSTPKIVDVNFAADTGGQDWRTLLVGGLGKGGAAYYALDVTDPASITSEAAAANHVLWEFKNADLGYTYGKPMIAKTRAFNGAWLVIVASGYNNASGNGNLYFIRARDGVLLKTMSTGVGTSATPSGLAHPAGYTKDFHNQLAEQIYAGDLLGNFWRFDVSDPNPGNWTVGQLARLVDPSGVPQPVTTPPQIEIDISNGIDRWVFVGTGELYDDSDLANLQQQTMYALRDGTADTPWPLPGSPLDRFTPGLPQVSHNAALDFGLTNKPDKGWYDDLPIGQRIVVPPVAALSVVAYIGTSAQTDPCLTGMQANVYARNYATGQSLFTDTSGNPIESVAIAEGGVGIEFVGLETASGTSTPDIRLAITTATKGDVIILKPNLPALVSQHRMSWRLLGQ